MGTTKAYRTWSERLRTGVTNAQARQFCHAIYTRACGYRPGGHACAVTDEEAALLLEELHEARPLVVGGTNSYGHGCVDEETGRWRHYTDAERGRIWLAKYAKRLRFPDLPWEDIVQFRFVRCRVFSVSSYGYAEIDPVYAAEFADGTVFEYAPSPWQSGRKEPPPWRTLRPNAVVGGALTVMETSPEWPPYELG